MTEITRTIQIEDKTVHIHLHLTEGEIRRLLLPYVIDAFASELRSQTTRYISYSTNRTTFDEPIGSNRS